MAMGDRGASGQNAPNYFPRMRIQNYDNNTVLRHSYGSGLLRLGISFRSGDTTTGMPNYEEQATISLTPLKARILYNELVEWRKDPTRRDRVGTHTGLSSTQSFITFANFDDSSEEVPHQFVTIGKIDANGNIVSACDYEFPIKANYGVVWDDFTSGDCHKHYQEGLDMDMLEELFKDFARSSNGAYAYHTLDMGRYTIDKSLDALLDHFGIERKGKSQSPSNGYFSKMDSRPQSQKQSSEFGDTSEIEDSLS